MDDNVLNPDDDRHPVTTPEAPPASGGYSQGISAGGFLFLAGQGPYDSAGRLVAETIEAQVSQILSNLDAVARAAGASLFNAVRVGVYLSDLRHFEAMDTAYRSFFNAGHPLPARTTIQSSLIGFDVEIDAVVWLPRTTPPNLGNPI